jgi:RNA-binding protein
VQHIGKLLVLWRPVPPKAKEVPEDRLPGPRTLRLVKFSKSPTHRPTIKKVKVLGNQRVTAGGLIKRAKRRVTSLKKKALG